AQIGDDPAARVGGRDEERVEEAIVREAVEAGPERTRVLLPLGPASTDSSQQVLGVIGIAHDRRPRADRYVAKRHRQDEVSGRIEYVLVEELGRDEERLGRVQLADEAVDVEADRHVERVALEEAAPDRLLAQVR